MLVMSEVGIDWLGAAEGAREEKWRGDGVMAAARRREVVGRERRGVGVRRRGWREERDMLRERMERARGVDMLGVCVCVCRRGCRLVVFLFLRPRSCSPSGRADSGLGDWEVGGF